MPKFITNLSKTNDTQFRMPFRSVASVLSHVFCPSKYKKTPKPLVWGLNRKVMRKVVFTYSPYSPVRFQIHYGILEVP